MRASMLSFALITLAFTCHIVAGRLLHSLPEDTYAFPKYRVTFLNSLPVLNETAERWLKEGLRGGELEFMEQPWSDDTWETPSTSPKEIDSGDATGDYTQPVASQSPKSSLQYMKMGPRDSYLCFIPKPLDNPQPSQEDESDADVTPVRSWSLLQPLTGTCLYQRQGWFTYSYCHNEEIRQFKELFQTQIHTPGGYKPEEDPDWESYTLGRAPATPEPGADLTVAQQTAITANLELARGAGSRYLVQRWGDGTTCDKTGKPREIEVQFHCSMSMTDHILFVKEAKTCSYVMVIHTPRLCGEPGFKSRLDAREEAYIRCREIVDSTTDPKAQLGSLLETDHPVKLLPHKPIPPPVVDKSTATGADGTVDKLKGQVQVLSSIRKALEALMGGKVLDLQDGDQDGEFPKVVVEGVTEDGEIFLEVLDPDDLPLYEGDDIERPGLHQSLAQALQAAGYDIKGEKIKKKDGQKDEKNTKKKGDRNGGDPYRQEL